MPPGERPQRPSTPPEQGPTAQPAPARAGTDGPIIPGAQLPLAQGELSDEDATELRQLKRLIQRRVGFYCEGYKERCLRRRLAVRMRARGVHSYSDYARLLERDGAEYQVLLDTLTINVSKFFRNPDVWQYVAETIVPELYARTDPTLHIWSAGAASGEEAYTISIVLHEYARAHGLTTDRFQIRGTDIDRESLAFAARAEYTDFAMTDIDPAMRDRWFRRDTVYHLDPAARHNVQFGTLDLIRDEYPTEQHLIFCRNVIIYFERSVQEMIFRKFHEALAPGAFLVLGKVEALFGAATGLFQPVANRQRIFRKR